MLPARMRASRCRAPRPSRTTRTACWSMSCRTSTRAGRTPAAKAASGSPGRTRDGSWCGSPPTRSPPAGRAHKPSARPPRLRGRLRPLWLLQSRDPLLRLRSQGARQGDEHVSEVATAHTAIRPPGDLCELAYQLALGLDRQSRRCTAPSAREKISPHERGVPEKLLPKLPPRAAFAPLSCVRMRRPPPRANCETRTCSTPDAL